MVRGQYAAATGMMLQRDKMEVVTNNLVNVETSGYKADTLLTQSFDEVLLERINDENIVSFTQADVGLYNFGVHVNYIATGFEQGIMETTDRTTDLAIAGDGFFAVQTPDGERYTRAGAFGVDQNGYLVTADGHFVLGTSGPLLVGSTDITVDVTGGITSLEGLPLGQLRLVTFEDNASLRKQGSNLFAGDAPIDSPAEVRQGMLEGSNVDTAREMVEMMGLYRNYETNQRMLTMIDETVGMAATDIGRLR